LVVKGGFEARALCALFSWTTLIYPMSPLSKDEKRRIRSMLILFCVSFSRNSA